MSLPHYRSDQFLQNAITRYKKFLHLKRVEPEVFLVPCYDFDLVWHVHQLHPVAYSADTKRHLGRLFNHDDTVNDRTPGSKLSDADARTRQLWKDNYEVSRDIIIFLEKNLQIVYYNKNVVVIVVVIIIVIIIIHFIKSCYLNSTLDLFNNAM